LPVESIIDNNILSSLIRESESAVKFVVRNRGFLSIDRTVARESVRRFNAQAVLRTLRRYDINFIRENQAIIEADARLLASRLGVRLNNDIRIIATAIRNNIGFVTGDRQAFSRALRAGISHVRFRVFQADIPLAVKITAYHRVRNLIRSQYRGIDPNVFTGSPR